MVAIVVGIRVVEAGVARIEVSVADRGEYGALLTQGQGHGQAEGEQD